MAGEYDKSKYTKKERFLNFLDYFKVYLIAGVLLVLFVVVQIHKIRNQKLIGFNAVYFNAVSSSMDEGQAYMDRFGEHIEIPENQAVEVQSYLGFDLKEGVDETELMTVQSMGAWMANGDLDVAIADEETFEYVAYWGALDDLRAYLPEEKMKELEPYLFYMDQVVADELSEYQYGSEEYNRPLPDPRKPEEMKNPIPVGIYLDNANEEFTSEFSFKGGTALIGIYFNTQNPDRCEAFIDYILK